MDIQQSYLNQSAKTISEISPILEPINTTMTHKHYSHHRNEKFPPPSNLDYCPPTFRREIKRDFSLN